MSLLPRSEYRGPLRWIAWGVGFCCCNKRYAIIAFSFPFPSLPSHFSLYVVNPPILHVVYKILYTVLPKLTIPSRENRGAHLRIHLAMGLHGLK